MSSKPTTKKAKNTVSDGDGGQTGRPKSTKKHRTGLKNRPDIPLWFSEFLEKHVCSTKRCGDDNCEHFKAILWNKFLHLVQTCPCCNSEACSADCNSTIQNLHKYVHSTRGLQAERDFERFVEARGHANTPAQIDSTVLPTKLECLGCYKYLQQEVCNHICEKRLASMVHKPVCGAVTERVWGLFSHHLSLVTSEDWDLRQGRVVVYRGCKNGGPKYNNTVRVCIDCCCMYTNSRRCEHMESVTQQKKLLNRPLFVVKRPRHLIEDSNSDNNTSSSSSKKGRTDIPDFQTAPVSSSTTTNAASDVSGLTTSGLCSSSSPSHLGSDVIFHNNNNILLTPYHSNHHPEIYYQNDIDFTNGNCDDGSGINEEYEQDDDDSSATVSPYLRYSYIPVPPDFFSIV